MFAYDTHIARILQCDHAYMLTPQVDNAVLEEATRVLHGQNSDVAKQARKLEVSAQ